MSHSKPSSRPQTPQPSGKKIPPRRLICMFQESNFLDRGELPSHLSPATKGVISVPSPNLAWLKLQRILVCFVVVLSATVLLYRHSKLSRPWSTPNSLSAGDFSDCRQPRRRANGNKHVLQYLHAGFQTQQTPRLLTHSRNTISQSVPTHPPCLPRLSLRPGCARRTQLLRSP